MKYFKPELLARCRSRDDEVAEAAATEWEEAVVAYRARLEAVRAHLPGKIERLRSRFSLHDAQVLGISFGSEKARFGILLRPEGSSAQPGKILDLNYHPAAGANGGVSIKVQDLAQGGPRRDVWVLYDEFDLDEQHGFFTHSLLLSDGHEIDVRFTSLTVRLLDEIISPVQLTDCEKKWLTACPAS